MEKPQIQLHQLYFLIVKTQVGVGILSLPYSVYGVSKNDAWISVIISGLLVQLLLFVIWLIAKRNEGKDLFDINHHVFGPIIGKAFNFVWFLYFMAIGIIILVLYDSLIKLWIFKNTPRAIIIGFFIMICCYLVTGGIKLIAKFYVLASILILIIIISVTIGLKEADYYYLFPIGYNGMGAIIKGAKECVIAMLGFELSLIFLGYTKGTSKEKLKIISFANLSVIALYTYVVFVTIVFYSPKEIIIVPEPVLYMLKEYSLVVIERLDLLFISFWIVIVATTFSSYLFASAESISSIFFKKKKLTLSTLLTGVIMFLLALLPEKSLLIDKLSNYIGDFSIYIITILPGLILITSFLRRKKHHEKA